MNTGKVVEGTIEQQTRLTRTHISKLLGSAGADLNDVVKCTCHLNDIREFDRFDAAYSEFFTVLDLCTNNGSIGAVGRNKSGDRCNRAT